MRSSPQGTLPAYCIPKVMRLKTGEVFYEKSYLSSSTTTKDLITTTITIGPEGKFNWILQLINSQKVRLFDSFEEKFNTIRSPQPTQPIPKPIRDRSGQPEDTQGVIVVKGETSSSHEIDEKGFHGENLVLQIDRWNPDKLSENTRVEQNSRWIRATWWAKQLKCIHGERTICSWRKSWHCVIQRVQPCNQRGGHWLQHSRTTTCLQWNNCKGASVRDLIQKIENHPNRHALQRDLQQRESII